MYEYKVTEIVVRRMIVKRQTWCLWSVSKRRWEQQSIVVSYSARSLKLDACCTGFSLCLFFSRHWQAFWSVPIQN